MLYFPRYWSDTSFSLRSRCGGNVASLLLTPEKQMGGIPAVRMTVLPTDPTCCLPEQRKMLQKLQPGHTQPVNYINTSNSWEDNAQRCPPSPFLM